jgi:hypothetical protein
MMMMMTVAVVVVVISIVVVVINRCILRSVALKTYATGKYGL